MMIVWRTTFIRNLEGFTTAAIAQRNNPICTICSLSISIHRSKQNEPKRKYNKKFETIIYWNILVAWFINLLYKIKDKNLKLDRSYIIIFKLDLLTYIFMFKIIYSFQFLLLSMIIIADFNNSSLIEYTNGWNLHYKFTRTCLIILLRFYEYLFE